MRPARSSGPRLAPMGDRPLRQPLRERRGRLGVVDQVRVACEPHNRLAAALGFALGGLVPVASYQLAHYELRTGPLWAQSMAWVVLGALVFSALSVFGWARLAFESPLKALGFVILLEGVLVGANTTWLGITALVYLVAINGIATGCRLALGGRR